LPKRPARPGAQGSLFCPSARLGRFPILRRVRRLALLLLVALGVFGLSSCGGDGDQKGVENLLDKAFSGQIRSADLKLNAEIELKGLLKDPIKIEADGPFRTNKGKLPSADIELRIGSGDGGQTVTSGVLTTGDRVFLKFQDVYYEQPPAQVRQANQSLAKGKSGRPLSELGLDPRSWLAEATDEGDAEVGGVQTNHVSGTLDVARLMRNLNVFVRKSATALGSSKATPPRLTAADIKALTDAVKNPSFDIYSGKQDNLIRRVSGRVEFDIPEASQASLGGLKGGSIKFSIELQNVNGNQQIEAPSHSRPLSKLTDSLAGTLGALGTGGGSTSQEPGPEKGQGSGNSTNTDQFRKYADCLDKAHPQDTEQLQRCADLLHQP
jgi:hypothetical protein